MAKILQKNGVYARVGGGPLNACRLKSISFFNEEDAVLPTQNNGKKWQIFSQYLKYQKSLQFWTKMKF